MSESGEDDLHDIEGGPSWEELGHKTYDPKLVKYHTEILKPDPFTSMDDYAEFCAEYISPKVAKLIQKHQENMRTNMVSYKRKRAQETVEMVKGNIENEKHKKDIEELLLGRMNR